MAEAYDLILKGGTVVNHDGALIRDVAVPGWPHRRVLAASTRPREVLDCTGLHVLPGVIDTQVHLREPGAEHKEDLETGGRAAVLGGVTGVFEMPNTKPTTVTAQALADKIAPRHQPHAMRFCLLRRRHRATMSTTLPRLEKLARLRRHQGLHWLIDRRPAGR